MPHIFDVTFSSNWKKSDGNTADALNITVYLGMNCGISWANSSYIEE